MMGLALPTFLMTYPEPDAKTSACRREMRRSGSGSASVFESDRPIEPPSAPIRAVIGWVIGRSLREMARKVSVMAENAIFLVEETAATIVVVGAFINKRRKSLQMEAPSGSPEAGQPSIDDRSLCCLHAGAATANSGFRGVSRAKYSAAAILCR